ncbi:MAG: hypothetical protein ACR2KK_06380 [Acidimicrobiales bacterium]
MTSPVHADFEAISAYVDGEAPEWADHIAACAACRATAARVRKVAAAVGAPEDGPADAVRDRAIAAALGAASPLAGAPHDGDADRHQAERGRFARRRSAPAWAMPAVAAVLVGLLGVSGFVLAGSRSSDETTTVAGRPLDADAKTDSLAESSPSGVAAAAPPVPASDLGDLPDAVTLRARAQVGVSSAGAVVSRDAASGGRTAATANGGTGAVVTPTTTLTQRVAPSVVGTRPCEEQARTREPTLGPVVYFATARKGPVAGFVLGFAPSTGPVTLLLLAQDGCAELLRVAGP